MKNTSNLARILIGLALAAMACDSQVPVDSTGSAGAGAQEARAVAPQSQVLTGAYPTVETDGVPRSHRTELARLTPTNGLDFETASLCRMVRHPGYRGHGLYEVTKLTAYIEQIDGREVSATYAELTRLQDFNQGEAKVVVRMDGGPMANGDTALWDIDLAVGETVAVLGFVKPSRGNLGYYTLDPTHVLKRRAGGGYSNGQLFTRRQVDGVELRRLVGGLAGRSLAEPCAYDEGADFEPEAPSDAPLQSASQVHPDVTVSDDDAR